MCRVTLLNGCVDCEILIPSFIDETVGDLRFVKHAVVGVSGGSDSVALLHFLCTLRVNFGLTFDITAAHVNHMLRGSESDRDESFVRNFCKENSVPLKVLKIDVASEAANLKKGVEETARHLRYEFFRSLVCDSSGAFIFVAHTLTDSIETVVMNMLRGGGLRGFCGIRKNRGGIIRPFIHISKRETEK